MTNEIETISYNDVCNLWNDLEAAKRLCDAGLLDIEKCLDIQLLAAKKFKEYADTMYDFAKNMNGFVNGGFVEKDSGFNQSTDSFVDLITDRIIAKLIERHEAAMAKLNGRS